MKLEIVKTQKRNIDVVMAEIKSLCSEARHMMLIYAIEIGRRLVEAKDILPHGEWGDWLRNEVEFSQSTANKHMKLFEKFGARQISLLGAELNSETFTNLTYSQALKLISVPDEELEDFVKDNDIEHKSVREIERLVKERDAAAEKAAAAEHELNEFLKEAEERKQELEKECQNTEELRNDIREMKQELEKAQNEAEEYRRLAEDPEIPQEQIDRLKAEIEAETKEKNAKKLKTAIAKAEKKLAEAEAARQEAEQEAEKANRQANEESVKRKSLQEQVDKLRNELEKSRSESLVRVNILFENTQRYIDEMNILLDGVPDGDVYRGKILDTLCSMFELTAE